MNGALQATYEVTDATAWSLSPNAWVSVFRQGKECSL